MQNRIEAQIDSLNMRAAQEIIKHQAQETLALRRLVRAMAARIGACPDDVEIEHGKIIINGVMIL